MSEPKWTPGPWYMILDDTGGPFTGWPSIVAAPELDLTIVHRAGFKQEFWGDTNDRVATANARLIATAPELYEALAGLVYEIETDGGVDTSCWPMQSRPSRSATRAVEAGKKALAKARGGN